MNTCRRPCRGTRGVNTAWALIARRRRSLKTAWERPPRGRKGSSQRGQLGAGGHMRAARRSEASSPALSAPGRRGSCGHGSACTAWCKPTGARHSGCGAHGAGCMARAARRRRLDWRIVAGGRVWAARRSAVRHSAARSRRVRCACFNAWLDEVARHVMLGASFNALVPCGWRAVHCSARPRDQVVAAVSGCLLLIMCSRHTSRAAAAVHLSSCQELLVFLAPRHQYGVVEARAS